MGRKKRHTSRTGDGGGELRLAKQRAAAAEREQKEAELAFYDDPSDDENNSEDVDSDGSEYGNGQEALELGGSDDEEEDSEDDEDDVDDDSDNAEDFEGEKKKILQMDGKWGNSKKNFYSADTAEFELDSDEEAAKDEEDAALELQRKQAEMMDEEDFGFGDDVDEDDDADEQSDDVPVDDEDLVGAQLADISMLVDQGDGSSIEQVHKDFSKMSKKDKLQIVNQSAPELLGLMAELENTMKELKEVITPAILKLKDICRKTKGYNTGLQYLVTRQNLMLNYVSNISFYMLLRAEGKSVVDHPVLQHLLALKKQMNKMQSVDEAVEAQLSDLLTKEFPVQVDDGMSKFFASSTKEKKQQQQTSQTALAVSTSPKKQKKTVSKVSKAEKEEAAKFYEAALREKAAVQQTKKEFYSHEQPGLESSDEDSDMEDAKRGASYEIIKNRGLKAHKSKLNRNPRVKKRMQFRKAVIRRKGQVRDVRVGEASKYGGETTGIKANLTRSRKIRN
uniref:Sas10 C-terminal domain-containing protein n=1 Tax=Globisporangium ultimum (strain ATCC 200006 / CBS 805.95 / DAOM BR144) TaxID=431595 RepID=K3WST8_GLOUD